jgi:hypothetical protein
VTALLVACGALAREVVTARDRNGWDARILALPAQLHNVPDEIPAAVERRVSGTEAEFEPVIVVYGDCGTGGRLKRLLETRGWLGLTSPHCYSTYVGEQAFDEMMRAEPGTFFLTDYLVGSFDHLVLEGLGLDRYPELMNDYFAHYRRVVYLQQRRDPMLLIKAQEAAQALGLPLEVRYTGLKALEAEIEHVLSHPSAPMHISGQGQTSAAAEFGP